MSEKTRLLVRADDAGSSWSSNIGCFRACTEGIAQSVEVMMPGAWVLHAAELFNSRPDIDIGIHLTLTSEWDFIKWRPLTHAPSLADEHGNFLPLLLPREGDPRKCLAQTDWLLNEIEAEFRAQIDLGLKMFNSVSHISSHMIRHFKDFDPRLGDMISGLCADFDLADDAFGYGLERIEGYPKSPKLAKFRTEAFLAQISDLKRGTYIFIDHPAEPSHELDITGHKGYEDVAADRTSCLQTLLSERISQRLDELGIELISYKNI